jgi:hypothetical protein
MVQKTMSPIELAERLVLVLALAFLVGLAPIGDLHGVRA